MDSNRRVQIDWSKQMGPNRWVHRDRLKWVQIDRSKQTGPTRKVQIDSSKQKGPNTQVQIDKSKQTGQNRLVQKDRLIHIGLNWSNMVHYSKIWSKIIQRGPAQPGPVFIQNKFWVKGDFNSFGVVGVSIPIENP